MKGKPHNCIGETKISYLIADAISNERYEKAIYKIRPHIRCLSDDQKYSLALLYDHHASRQEMTGTSRRRHVATAENIYRKILYRNPKHVLSWLGMGRIQILKGNVSRALAFDKKAYELLTQLPLSKRGALGIGGVYEQFGRIKLAERWYLKEQRLCGSNDFGTTLNLFRFYKRNGPVQKSKVWARRLRKLLDGEFRKPQYKGKKMKASKFVQEIRRDLTSTDGVEIRRPS